MVSMDPINPTLSVLYSELVLSLYPVLIKSVQTNTFTQVLGRFLVFPALAFAFGSTNDFRLIWGNPYEAFVGILNSVFNLLHIGVSYLSFKELPIGTAISLFYLYPIFNVLAGTLFFGESISFFSILFVLLAFYGVYLITTSYKDKDKKKSEKYQFGVLMGILAAITETLIFVFIRSNKDAQASPFYTVNHLYPAGLAGLLAYAISRPTLVDTNTSHWLKILGFNALLGFTGYVARFYAIPRIPTIVFSLLSFIGVFFGYMWGILFTKDEITTRALMGSGLIASSIAVLRYMELL
jgi:drug/metabolite transporter (DMT)-like permease